MRPTRLLPLAAWAATVALLLPACSASELRPPSRLGPPALVLDAGAPCLWWLTKQEELRQEYDGPGSDYFTPRTVYHIDLQCHDPQTTARRWKTRLVSLENNQGGSSAEARILGQDGSTVWIFLQDQPIAVSSRDGSVLASRATLAARNGAIATLLPRELKFYAFDAGLVVTTADARRCRVHPTDFVCAPYVPASEDEFSQRRFLSTEWNGAFSTADFETRMAMVDGRWLGLYTAKEALDVGNDELGRRLSGATPIFNEGRQARRTFWTARIGKTRAFPEGVHDRLVDVARVPDAREYLDAGFLKRQGTREPLAMRDPAGLLVLSRTRVDAEGRLALTRIDAALRERWQVTLPMQQLTSRFEFPDRLLLWGEVPVTIQGATSTQEVMATVDLKTGRVLAWNATLERDASVEGFGAAGGTPPAR